MRASPALAGGHALIEALVAAVVLSIGLLGGVALMVDGVRASRGARLAGTAAALVSDLGERIRANRTAGAAYALDADRQLGSPGELCTAACDAATVAAVDLYDWQRAALASLPGARTSVAVSDIDGGTSRRYDITLEWTVAGRDGPARLGSVVVS